MDNIWTQVRVVVCREKNWVDRKKKMEHLFLYTKRVILNSELLS